MAVRTRSPKSAGTWLVLLLFPFLPGCLIPYAFPTISYVPAVELGEEAAPVYAFRIDSTSERPALLGLFEWIDFAPTDDWTLTQVSMLAPGWVPSQTKVSGTYGCFLFGPNVAKYTSHTVALRLYRPGYDLVEIDSWQLADKVAWQRSPDLEAQERALDRLFLMGEKQTQAFSDIDRRLQPGSALAQHRQALLFGASEYDRLAAGMQPGASNAEEVRKRLADKANTLRALAEE